jgi:hypothetical protein
MSAKKEPNYPLIFDLYGPFVLNLHKPNDRGAGGSVTIYAPLCEDHHANLLTDQDDISLCGLQPPPPLPCGSKPSKDKHPLGPFRYHLRGPVSSEHASKCDPHMNRQLLRVYYPSKSGAAFQSPPTPFHFMMTAALPNYIMPLRPEQVWIHSNDCSTWITAGCQDDTTITKHDPKCIVDSHRARGLRFIYEKSDYPKVHFEGPNGTTVPGLDELNASTRLAGSLIASHYSMTLRYAGVHSESSSSSVSDSEADAYSCFQSMRQLYPELADWRADFTNQNAKELNEMVGGTNPHDCFAPPIVRQDYDDPKSAAE